MSWLSLPSCPYDDARVCHLDFNVLVESAILTFNVLVESAILTFNVMIETVIMTFNGMVLP